MSGGHACLSRCKKHDVPYIATVTDSIYCAVCEHAEANRLRELLAAAEAEVDRARAEYEKEFCEHVTTSQRLQETEAAVRSMYFLWPASQWATLSGICRDHQCIDAIRAKGVCGDT